MSPLHLLAFVLLVAMLVAFVQIGVLSVAFDKLGLSFDSAMLLLFASLFGSGVNLPLFTMRSEAPLTHRPPWGFFAPYPAQRGRILVAVNVGGGLIPVFFSLYLMRHNALGLALPAAAIALVAAIAYLVSRPIPGMGIGMPVFVAPISAALVALLLAPEQSAPLAYVCGTLGVLVGADLLRLKDIRRLGAPVASIGGAGTFDGIFITGIVAVLLA